MLKKFFELLKKGDLKGLLVEPTEDSFLQFFRYIFVGGASFVTDYVFLHIITEIGVHYILSGAISFTVGLCVNYVLSKLLVFSKKTTGTERAKEFFRFCNSCGFRSCNNRRAYVAFYRKARLVIIISLFLF